MSELQITELINGKRVASPTTAEQLQTYINNMYAAYMSVCFINSQLRKYHKDDEHNRQITSICHEADDLFSTALHEAHGIVRRMKRQTQ